MNFCIIGDEDKYIVFYKTIKEVSEFLENAQNELAHNDSKVRVEDIYTVYDINKDVKLEATVKRNYTFS
jgi:hypothetical protein